MLCDRGGMILDMVMRYNGVGGVSHLVFIVSNEVCLRTMIADKLQNAPKLSLMPAKKKKE